MKDRDNENFSATAAALCAFGLLLRLLLSAPTLQLLGSPYGDADGSGLAKIHPGNFFIYASFFVLLMQNHSPIGQLVRMARQQTAYLSLFFLYLILIAYWIFRGPKGVGVMLDQHLVMPMAVLVLCYAPRLWLGRILYGFVFFATLNSLIGLGEAATHSRILPYDSSWEVTKQSYFRASALMGHPLANAAFTSCGLFVVLAIRLPILFKIFLVTAMLASLIGFGGRSSLGLCVIGLACLGIVAVYQKMRRGSLSVLQLISLILACLLVPLLCGGLLYGVLHSSVGERLMAYSSLQDESAEVRLRSWQVFDYTTTPELIFGIDGDRVLQIGDHLGLINPTSDIENPWILIFLFLGGILFPLWLANLLWFMRSLLKGASPALVMAVLDYFLIASTSNSFARKDPVFIFLPALILVAKRYHFPVIDEKRRTGATYS